MIRSAHWLVLPIAASLLSGCAATPQEPYASATQPARECQVGSRICREIDPRTGRAISALPITTLEVNGEEVHAVLRKLPYAH